LTRWQHQSRKLWLFVNSLLQLYFCYVFLLGGCNYEDFLLFMLTFH
jgi:hypothetical protein